MVSGRGFHPLKAPGGRNEKKKFFERFTASLNIDASTSWRRERGLQVILMFVE
jgi:hypothetical protein